MSFLEWERTLLTCENQLHLDCWDRSLTKTSFTATFDDGNEGVIKINFLKICILRHHALYYDFLFYLWDVLKYFNGPPEENKWTFPSGQNKCKNLLWRVFNIKDWKIDLTSLCLSDLIDWFKSWNHQRGSLTARQFHYFMSFFRLSALIAPFFKKKYVRSKIINKQGGVERKNETMCGKFESCYYPCNDNTISWTLPR